MNLPPDDELMAASLATEQDYVIMVTQKGQSIKFPVASLRVTSRTAGGVRGMRLLPGDRLISADTAHADTYLLVVTTGGFGKITSIEKYPRQRRAGSGVRTFKLTSTSGEVAAAKQVSLSQHVMIISAQGIVTCTPVKENDPRRGITTQGRDTQGVRLMRLDHGDKVVAITCFD
jgi:DNA gyrase subunit A